MISKHLKKIGLLLILIPLLTRANEKKRIKKLEPQTFCAVLKTNIAISQVDSLGNYSSYSWFNIHTEDFQIEYYAVTLLPDLMLPVSYKENTTFTDSSLSDRTPVNIKFQSKLYKLKLSNSIFASTMTEHILYSVQHDTTYILLKQSFISVSSLSGNCYIMLEFKNDNLLNYFGEMYPVKKHLSFDEAIKRLHAKNW